MRSLRNLGVLVAAGLVLTACTSSSPRRSDETTSSVPSHARQIDVTLDDSGLHATPSTASAGRYDVSFSDRRATRSGAVVLGIEVQPRLGATTVRAGATRQLLLCPHAWFLDVTIDGAYTVPPANLPQLDITGTDPACRTPIT